MTTFKRCWMMAVGVFFGGNVALLAVKWVIALLTTDYHSQRVDVTALGVGFFLLTVPGLVLMAYIAVGFVRAAYQSR